MKKKSLQMKDYILLLFLPPGESWTSW